MMKALKNIFVLLLVVFLWPIGLIIMWKWTKWSRWIKVLLTVIVVLPIVFTFIYWFIAQPFKVSGSSMAPNLNNAEYFMAKKYDREFTFGEIVTYKHPEDLSQTRIGRIVGLPGQTVEIKNGNVYINSKKLTEPYILSQNNTNPIKEEHTKAGLQDDEYYMLGDNREHSMDSRAVGKVKKELIIGSYWFTYSRPE